MNGHRRVTSHDSQPTLLREVLQSIISRVSTYSRAVRVALLQRAMVEVAAAGRPVDIATGPRIAEMISMMRPRPLLSPADSLTRDVQSLQFRESRTG